MPKISVITTVYDAKEYLPLTIKSILAQTHRDLELILVDDGSPNGCGAICDEWAAKDSRIKVIHKPNGGPATASNAGLDAATGDYIGFVDSDDLIEPDLYEKLLAAMQQSGCKLAGCRAGGIDETGAPLPEKSVDCPFIGVQDALDLFYDTFQNGGMYAMLCWNKLMAAELWQGVRFDTSFTYGDDCNVLHRIYDGQKIFCLNEELYHYRSRAGSLTAKPFRPAMLDDLRLYRMWYEFLLAKPDRQDLAQWALARWWQRFYLFYVQARQQNQLNSAAKAAFADYRAQLKALMPCILACPHISGFEKKRAKLFAASPALAYSAAALWGKLQGGKA